MAKRKVVPPFVPPDVPARESYTLWYYSELRGEWIGWHSMGSATALLKYRERTCAEHAGTLRATKHWAITKDITTQSRSVIMGSD